jgi:hypothetical protein
VVRSYSLDLPEEGTPKRQKFDDEVTKLVHRISDSKK